MIHALLPAFLFFVVLSGLMLAATKRFDPRNYALATGLCRDWRVFAALAAVLWGLIGAEFVAYLLDSQIIRFDAEAGSMGVSVLWSQGHPLYPTSATGHLYALLYGPLLFVFYGLPFLFGATDFFSPRLMAVILFVGGWGLTLLAFRQYKLNKLTGYFLATLAAYLVVLFGRSVLSARADIVLFFLVALSLYLLRFRLALPAILALAGVAVGFKVSAGAYFLPLLWLAAFKTRQEQGWQRLGLLTALGIILVAGAIAFPFALNGIDLSDYLAVLKVAGAHPFDFQRALVVTGSVLAFAAFPLAIAVWRQSALNTESRVLLVLLVVTAGVYFVLSGKVGAGPYHLFPLLPIYLLALCRLVAPLAASPVPWGLPAQAASGGFMATSLFIGLLFLLNTNYVVAGLAAGRYPVTPAVLNELQGMVEEAQKPVILAYGKLENRRSSLAANAYLFGASPFVSDIALWDLMASGQDHTDAATKRLATCEFPSLIALAGEDPFAGESLYTAGAVMAPKLHVAAQANYRKVKSGVAFDLYQCSK